MQKIDQILKSFIQKSPYKKRLEESHALVVWPRVVGDAISRQSKPLRIKDGILFVKVEHAVWKHELFMQKTEIMNQLNRYLQSNIIKDIRFQ